MVWELEGCQESSRQVLRQADVSVRRQSQEVGHVRGGGGSGVAAGWRVPGRAVYALVALAFLGAAAFLVAVFFTLGAAAFLAALGLAAALGFAGAFFLSPAALGLVAFCRVGGGMGRTAAHRAVRRCT